MQKNVWKSLTI